MNMDGFMDLMATQIRANASDKNVDSLSAQTIQFLLDSFRMFDQDKDGYLNEAEIKVLNSNTNNSQTWRHNKLKWGWAEVFLARWNWVFFIGSRIDISTEIKPRRCKYKFKNVRYVTCHRHSGQVWIRKLTGKYQVIPVVIFGKLIYCVCFGALGASSWIACTCLRSKQFDDISSRCQNLLEHTTELVNGNKWWCNFKIRNLYHFRISNELVPLVHQY